MTPEAPGSPGIDPTWTSSAKDLVGASMGTSRIWFTLGFGVLNEVYWPRVDAPQIRDLGFIVSGPGGFWQEVKRLQSYTLELAAPGTPLPTIVHTHPRFTLTLRITPDPDRDVLAIETTLEGDQVLEVYVLLAPHLGASGYENRGAVATISGRRLLVAEQDDDALALSVVDTRQRDALGPASVGYVGASDAWQDFDRNGGFTWSYPEAGPGNIALSGRIPRQAVLSLGFGPSIEAAAVLAISSAQQPFARLLERQEGFWRRWHDDREKTCAACPEPGSWIERPFLISSMVLRSHRDKTYPGTMVASLSIPWGTRSNDRGGYHLVWPRDLVSCAGALLALGAEADARNTLRYLIATQKGDGSWNQNQWLGGLAYWSGVQLDETAFPVLLAAALQERNALLGVEVGDMTRRALSFIAGRGPSSDQDRWEENAGLNAFTLAAVLGALVAGADFLAAADAEMALALADTWNERIEDWLVVHGGAHAQAFGVDRYYVRIAPAEVIESRDALSGKVQVKNHGAGGVLDIDALVSTDFLQLVRFGVRKAEDPSILSSVAVVDGLLKVETPCGAAWRRYNEDGYGEHPDGAPFDGTGQGRAWPLLAGERGHYEVAAGRDPEVHLKAMDAMAGAFGMMPEQVWDAAPIPERGLMPGRPSGSAMPLAWAHAEFIKLAASKFLGRPFDRPEAVWRRWGGVPATPATAVWTLAAPIGWVRSGQDLLIALPRPARITVRAGGGAATVSPTHAAGLDLHTLRVAASELGGASELSFEAVFTETEEPMGRAVRVAIRGGPSPGA